MKFLLRLSLPAAVATSLGLYSFVIFSSEGQPICSQVTKLSILKTLSELTPKDSKAAIKTLTDVAVTVPEVATAQSLTAKLGLQTSLVTANSSLSPYGPIESVRLEYLAILELARDLIESPYKSHREPDLARLSQAEQLSLEMFAGSSLIATYLKYIMNLKSYEQLPHERIKILTRIIPYYFLIPGFDKLSSQITDLPLTANAGPNLTDPTLELLPPVKYQFGSHLQKRQITLEITSDLITLTGPLSQAEADSLRTELQSIQNLKIHSSVLDGLNNVEAYSQTNHGLKNQTSLEDGTEIFFVDLTVPALGPGSVEAARVIFRAMAADQTY